MERKRIALDIDETLSDTNFFFTQYVHGCLPNPYNISVEEIVAKRRHTNDVPFWEKDELNRVRVIAQSDKELTASYGEINYAQKYVKMLIDEHVDLDMYISTRPDDIYDVTVDRLECYGFPQADVILRPKKSDNDQVAANAWKAIELAKKNDVVWGIVDDNIGFPEKAREAGYTGYIFVFDYDTDEWIDDTKTIPCKDRKTTYMTITELLDQSSV